MESLNSLLPDAAANLAMALIASSQAPLLLLDDELVVIAASNSFCHAFGVAAGSVAGKPLATLGSGEWSAPQLQSLLGATIAGRASVDAYELNLKRDDQPTLCLLLNARRLDYFDAEHVRLLVAVTDVTASRKSDKDKDDLLRDRQLLLRELQHRVANSLQIIASILMQSATRVQNDEVRVHLHNAHSRVMSIATLQKQLSVAQVEDVALRAYFSDLCKSIAASMIGDPERLSLATSVDDSGADPDRAVSLGLIATELIINALKHAFPDGRRGAIKFDYAADGEDWRMSVTDDGVGMAADPGKPGLGTGIVAALAGQLDAEVLTTDCAPGTRVEIIHAAAA